MCLLFAPSFLCTRKTSVNPFKQQVLPAGGMSAVIGNGQCCCCHVSCAASMAKNLALMDSVACQNSKTNVHGL